MKKLLIVILAIILVGCATEPTKWKQTDKQLMWLYVAGQIIDYGQTNDIYENEDKYKELNPVVDAVHKKGGKPAWAAMKMAETTTTIFIADRLKPKWRRRFLIGANLVLWGFVTNNFAVGLGWSF